MTSAGPAFRSVAIAGSAMLAIAVSSEAMVSAVKIAVTAHFRRSAGRPSTAAGLFAEIISVDIRAAPFECRDVGRIGPGQQAARCMPHMLAVNREPAVSPPPASAICLPLPVLY